jgi:hypothetical protein
MPIASGEKQERLERHPCSKGQNPTPMNFPKFLLNILSNKNAKQTASPTVIESFLPKRQIPPPFGNPGSFLGLMTVLCQPEAKKGETSWMDKKIRSRPETSGWDGFTKSVMYFSATSIASTPAWIRRKKSSRRPA